MPSPPPAADDAPVDLEHLRRMTLGNPALEREVLAMFARQAGDLAGVLAAMPAAAGALAHTLKGSARAIGAFRVAAAAEALETTIRDSHAPAQALADLRDAVGEAQAAIAAILRRS
jgi:HPt (histidine-containing phosphotransfer) domain-containing protein